MQKDYYQKFINNTLKNKESKKIFLEQIDNFFEAKKETVTYHKRYALKDKVILEKGSLLHGTYKNLSGLNEIIKNGFVAGVMNGGRRS